MRGTVSGWKRLRNGGVIESKIWPTLVSSNRPVFPISTAVSTKELLWRLTINQKLSPTEKGTEWWRGIVCVGGGKEKQQSKWIWVFLGRGAERDQKISACYWYHRDFKREFKLSDVLHQGTCGGANPVEKLREKLPRMLLTQTCVFPVVLTLCFSLSWPFRLRCPVIADVAIGFCFFQNEIGPENLQRRKSQQS